MIIIFSLWWYSLLCQQMKCFLYLLRMKTMVTNFWNSMILIKLNRLYWSHQILWGIFSFYPFSWHSFSLTNFFFLYSFSFPFKHYRSYRWPNSSTINNQQNLVQNLLETVSIYFRKTCINFSPLELWENSRVE